MIIRRWITVELPKVLIFTITYEGKDYALNDFLESVKKIDYPKEYYKHIIIDNSKGRGYVDKLRAHPLVKELGISVYHVERGNNTREALARSQNFARYKFLKGDYTHALSLESDLMIKPDTLKRLLGAGKDVVSALYYIGHDNYRVPCITVNDKKPNGLIGSRLLRPEEVPAFTNNGLVPVHNGGLGCTLIKGKVLDEISFYYYPELKNHSDSFFANDVWRKGFRFYVDTNHLVEHRNVPWTTVSDR